MSDRASRRRMFYAIDRGQRQRRKNQRGPRKSRLPETRASWSRPEVEKIIGISQWTITQYMKMGIIPRPTYPSSKSNHRYWNHQAKLLVELFNEMRKEGWPRRVPHFVGSGHWTQFLARLRSEWEKEPDDFRKWKAGCGNDHSAGENSAGEHASV